MEQYYFLYGLALAWILFAVVQDLRTREISNWLNFSLIGFVLAYRAFYSIFTGSVDFFLYGLFGVLMFVGLAFVFYYGKVFAGGDAKLLMGLGGVLPYQGLFDYLFLGIGFILTLFILGAIYSVIYSLFLISKKKKEFFREFGKEFKEKKKWIYIALTVGVVLELSNYFLGFNSYGFVILFFILLPVLIVYAKALDLSVMIKKVSALKLTEGDWLERDVKVGRKTIRKNVHGLSLGEIKLLRKAKKKVWIKEGIPFSPAFLFALLAFLWFLSSRYFPI